MLASAWRRPQTRAMLGTWLLLALLVCAVWAWMDALTARERAVRFGQELCRDAGVQLLDQSVALRRIRVERVNGLPTLIRRYGFEISMDGSDRHRGHLDLRGGHELGAWSLPHKANLRAVPVSNVVPLRTLQ